MTKQRPANFYERATVVDSIKSSPTLTPQMIKLLINLLTDEDYSFYFFNNLNDPKWLQILFENGIYDNPPQKIQLNEKSYSYSHWPPSQYLERVSAQVPDVATKIISSIQTDNPWIQLNLMHAALQLPVQFASQLPIAITSWLQNDQTLADYLAFDIAKLASKLANAGDLDAVIPLVRALTELAPPPQDNHADLGWTSDEPKPRYDAYWFKEAVMHLAADVEPRYPFELLEIYRSRLDEANRYLRGGHDYWRPSIKGTEHDAELHLYDYLQIVLNRVVHLMEHFANTAPHKIEPLINTDLKHDLLIFQRLAIYVISINPTAFSAAVESLYETREFLDSKPFNFEYFQFLRRTFAKTSQNNQERMLEWILQSFSGAEDEVDYYRVWTVRYLKAIKNHLPIKVLEQFPELEEYPDDPTPSGIGAVTFWMGSISPKTRDDVRALSDIELLNYLQEFQPEDGLRTPSREGLSNVLKDLVIEDPERFAKLALSFLDLHSIYLSRLFTGLQDAIQANKPFDWKPVIDLCNRLPVKEQKTLTEEDAANSHIRALAASLIRNGLITEDETIAIPNHLLPTVKAVIFRFFNSDESSWTWDETVDPVTVSLNTAHGTAAWALLSYALRHARQTYPQSSDSIESQPTSKLQPDVKSVLNSLIGDANATASIYAVLGTHLAQLMYLDSNWLSSVISQIFPKDLAKRKLWQATWRGYLFGARNVYMDLYPLIRSEYVRAINELRAQQVDKSDMIGSNMSLAQHIAILYLRGIETFQEDSLLTKYLSLTSHEGRADIVTVLGNQLRIAEDKREADAIWPALRTYWQNRIDVFTSDLNKDQYALEAQHFFGWLPHIPVPFDDIYYLLDATVQIGNSTGYENLRLMEYLLSNAEGEPKYSAQILWSFVENSKSYLPFIVDSVRSILVILIHSNDGLAYDIATKIINYYGENLHNYSLKNLLSM